MDLSRRALLAASTLPLATAAPASPLDEYAADTIQTQAQALCDAISAGDAAVWDRLLHAAVVYTDEEGVVSGKAALVAQISPLPKGISGVLKVTQFQAHRQGDIVIANYVNDETENYHGQIVHCQYRNTDTWIATGDGWRLLAVQALALRTDPPAVILPAADLAAVTGRYRLADDVHFEVRRAAAGGIEGQQTGGKPRPLMPEARDVFFNPGRPRYRFLFIRDGGRVVRMIERREAWDLTWTRVGANA